VNTGAASSPFAEIALEKLTRVFGVEKGRAIYVAALAAAGLIDLRSADDLFAFAAELSRRGGMEGAVGGLLSVASVLRGAGARKAG
jgi:hypothetical protein